MIQIAREIWYRGKNKKIKYESTEDRDFREFFGCGLSVASEIWDLLARENLLPQGGMQCHLLLALMFMKIYGKEKISTSCLFYKPQKKHFFIQQRVRNRQAIINKRLKNEYP